MLSFNKFLINNYLNKTSFPFLEVFVLLLVLVSTEDVIVWHFSLVPFILLLLVLVLVADSPVLLCFCCFCVCCFSSFLLPTAHPCLSPLGFGHPAPPASGDTAGSGGAAAFCFSFVCCSSCVCCSHPVLLLLSVLLLLLLHLVAPCRSWCCFSLVVLVDLLPSGAVRLEAAPWAANAVPSPHQAESSCSSVNDLKCEIH